MTEEGAKQILSDYRVVTGGFIDLREAIDIAIQSLEEIQQYRAIGTVEGYELAINESIDKHNLMIVYKDRLKEYESIGTIEEFKVLKNTDIPIIHGKAELDLNDNEVRNKAIDEFAERLQENVESFQTEINVFKADVLTLDYFVEFVYEIAEQLKCGAE